MDSDPYANALAADFVIKALVFSVILWGVWTLPKKIAVSWRRQRSKWKAASARRKLKREKSRMGSKREQRNHLLITQGLTDMLMDMFLNGQLSWGEMSHYNRKFAHTLKSQEMMPKDWVASLKARIKLRLKNEYNKDPDKLLKDHREKHPDATNIIRPKFGSDLLKDFQPGKKKSVA